MAILIPSRIPKKEEERKYVFVLMFRCFDVRCFDVSVFSIVCCVLMTVLLGKYMTLPSNMGEYN